MTWGHKVTLVAYVPGDIERAHELAEAYIKADVDDADCDFVGVMIEAVQDEPTDQIAT